MTRWKSTVKKWNQEKAVVDKEITGMISCSWCEKPVHVDGIVKFPMPDDDYVEICNECFFKEEQRIRERRGRPGKTDQVTSIYAL